MPGESVAHFFKQPPKTDFYRPFQIGAIASQSSRRRAQRVQKGTDSDLKEFARQTLPKNRRSSAPDDPWPMVPITARPLGGFDIRVSAANQPQRRKSRGSLAQLILRWQRPSRFFRASKIQSPNLTKGQGSAYEHPETCAQADADNIWRSRHRCCCGNADCRRFNKGGYIADHVSFFVSDYGRSGLHRGCRSTADPCRR
jgi:hypothetical protein